MSTSTWAIAELLKTRVPLFAGFSKAELENLIEHSETAVFRSDDTILRYGIQPTRLCIVLDGVVTASIVGAGEAQQQLVRLERNAVFGELAIMTGDSANIELVARSRCEIMLIPLARLHSEILRQAAA